MKRIVNTDNKELDLSKTYQDKSGGFKPAGLWYAIDNEWVEWCESEMPDWVRGGLIEIKVDLSKMIVIETAAQLYEFVKAFNYEPFKGFNSINWERVSQKYSGIEINNYYSLKYNEPLNFDYSWLYGWDCSSGCIWDLSIIESYNYCPLPTKETA